MTIESHLASGPLRRPSKESVHVDGISECPRLSVVVIGRNEGARLVRCLESIGQMTPLQGSIEVIYVDSGSTDGSFERAAQFKVKVETVESANSCAAVGRNAGWRAAKAPIVLFLDGDTVLERNFVADSIAEFNDPSVAVVFGNRREVNPKASIYNRVLDLDWNPPAGIVEFCGGDALIRREVLERVGGFDDRLIAGEEPEMCQRIRALGFSILHVDRPMTGHDLAMTRFSQYWRRAFRTGYAYAEVSTRFKSTTFPLWDKKARKNLIHGAGMLGIIIGAPLGAIALHSVIPFGTGVAIIVLLAIRTAIRFRWKTDDLATLLLFGLHSHLIQIPLLFGQLKYQRNRFTGRTTKLIEYKQDSRASADRVGASTARPA
jgi:cellulose synthase/poly-beta-1,6-N-acetylglucosamine synthase-like glycosyltransferase